MIAIAIGFASRMPACLIDARAIPHELALIGIAAALTLCVLSAPAEAQTGCVSAGRLYPEGAIVKPPLRSRLYARGHFLCRNGEWVFIKDVFVPPRGV